MNVYDNDDLYPYITGAMLGDRKSICVISAFAMELVFSKEARRKIPTPVLSFKGRTKKLILSRTNIDRIAYLYGPETDDWIGNPIELFTEEMTVAGKKQIPVRVSLERPTSQHHASRASPAHPAN